MPMVVPSDSDYDQMARVAAAEAEGENASGINGVLHVMRNRALSGKYGADIGTMLRTGGFEARDNPNARQAYILNSMPRTDPTYKRFRTAAEGVWDGTIDDPSHGSLSFYSPAGQAAKGRAPPRWGSQNPVPLDHQIFAQGSSMEDKDAVRKELEGLAKPLPTAKAAGGGAPAGIPAAATPGLESEDKDAVRQELEGLAKPLPLKPGAATGAAGATGIRSQPAGGPVVPGPEQGGGSAAAYRPETSDALSDLGWLGGKYLAGAAGLPATVFKDLPIAAISRITGKTPQEVMESAPPAAKFAWEHLHDPQELEQRGGSEPATSATGRVGEEAARSAGAGTVIGGLLGGPTGMLGGAATGALGGALSGGLSQLGTEAGLPGWASTALGLFGPGVLGKGLGAGTRIADAETRRLFTRARQDFGMPVTGADFVGPSALQKVGPFGISPLGPKLDALKSRVYEMTGGGTNGELPGVTPNYPSSRLIPEAEQRINDRLRTIEGGTVIPFTGTQLEGEYNTIKASAQNYPQLRPLFNDIESRVSNNGGILTGQDFGQLMETNARLTRAMAKDTGATGYASRVGDWLTRGFEDAVGPDVAAAYRTAKGQEAATEIVKPLLAKGTPGTIDPGQLQAAVDRFERTNAPYQTATVRDLSDLGDIGKVLVGQAATRSGGTHLGLPGLVLGGGVIGASAEGARHAIPYLAEQMTQNPTLTTGAGLLTGAGLAGTALGARAYQSNPAVLNALISNRGAGLPALGGITGGTPNIPLFAAMAAQGQGGLAPYNPTASTMNYLLSQPQFQQAQP